MRDTLVMALIAQQCAARHVLMVCVRPRTFVGAPPAGSARIALNAMSTARIVQATPHAYLLQVPQPLK